MGAYGEAVLVRQKGLSYNQFYLAKHILLKKLDREEQLKSFKNEAEILKELNSDHVVKYINSYQDNDKKLILVMEYCQCGDMSTQIKQRKLNKNQY
jgi:serine/threonine protein kinase